MPEDREPLNALGKRGRFTVGVGFDEETGAPSDQALQMIKTAAGLGLSVREIGLLLGFGETAWLNRRKKFPDINEAMEFGRVETNFQVSGSLMKRAMKGDVSAIRWFETTRQGRSEKVEQSVTEKQFVVAMPPNVSLQEWLNEFGPDDLKDNGDGESVSRSEDGQVHDSD